MRSSLAFLLLASLLGGCATTAGHKTWRDFSPSQPLSLVRSSSGADVDALVETFYASDAPFDPQQLRAQIDAALARHPHNARVHEVAAYTARLMGDTDRAWQHFMEACRDLSSPHTRLYIWELFLEDLRVGQRAAMARLMKNLEQQHPDPLVRHQAAVARLVVLSRIGSTDEVLAQRDSLGRLDAFRYIGPFDNDQGKGFLTPYPPEQELDLEASYEGRRVPIGWRTLQQLDTHGFVPLEELIHPKRFSVAYMVTWIHSDSPRSAWLRLISRQALRIWVNDGLVLSEQRVDSKTVDNLNAAIQLQAGWNKILIKTARKDVGSWSTAARLTDARGAPIAGLKQSAAFHPTPRQADREQTDSVALKPGLDLVKSPARRDFLEGRFLRMAGLLKRASKVVQRYHDQHPEKLVAIYEQLTSMWDTGEAGKAIDLLNRGVDLSGGKALQFLVKRSRFYAQKKRWERAQDDLTQVISANPEAYIAQMKLGELFKSRGWTIDRCHQFEQTLRRWPDSGWALRELASCLRKRGYVQQSRDLFRRSAALEPGQLWAIEQLSRMALARDQGELAWTHMQNLLKQRPQSLSYRLQAAELRRKLGDGEGARRYLLSAVAHCPTHPLPYRRLGDLAHEAADSEQAVRHWQLALKRDPDNSRLSDLLNYIAPEGLGLVEDFVPSDDAIQAAIDAAKGTEVHPGAGVLFALDHEVTEVKRDGSSTAVVTTVEVAVNKQGRDQLIRRSVPRGAKAKLLKAYSVSPEGEHQEAASIQGGTVRFRELEVGSVVVLQYVHHRPPPRFLPNHFVSSWFFEGMHRQHQSSTWVLLTPKGRPINIEASPSIRRQQRSVGEHDVRTFSVEAAPPVVAEPYMPPAGDVLAQVVVSTVEGWDEYVQWERALLADAFETNPELEQLATELTADATTKREAFDRLFHYVAQEIRYQQDYENTIAGVRPHQASLVLARRYGDCKDKAVLLILLARHVGIDVDFAVLRTTNAGKVRVNIPNQQFNHAIVYVPAQDGFEAGFFIDPTTDGLDMGVLRDDDQGATALIMDPETGKHRFEQIPLQKSDEQYSRYKIEIDAEQVDQAKASVTLELRGSGASSVRRTLRDSERARKFFDGVASYVFPGSGVNNFEAEDSENIWRPLKVALDLDVAPTIQAIDGGFRLPAPLMVPMNKGALLATRRFPLRLGVARHHEMTLDLLLPKGAKPTAVPPDFKIEHDCFKAERSSKVEKRGGRQAVKVRYVYSISCYEVSPQAYPEFRKAIFDVVAHEKDPVSFTAP